MTEYWQEFIAIHERIFPPPVLGKGLQRGLMFAGIVLLFNTIQMLILRQPGTWSYYRARAAQRIHQAALLADEVGELEGRAKGLEAGLEQLLRELSVRNGTPLGQMFPIGNAPTANPMPAPAVIPSGNTSAETKPPPLPPLPSA